MAREPDQHSVQRHDGHRENSEHSVCHTGTHYTPSNVPPPAIAAAVMAVVVVVYTGESVGCGAQLREMARAAAVEVTLAVAGMTVETTSDVPAAAAAPTVRSNCSGERSGSALAARFVDASQRKCGHRESVIQLQLQPAPPSKLLKTNDVRRFCGCRVATASTSPGASATPTPAAPAATSATFTLCKRDMRAAG